MTLKRILATTALTMMAAACGAVAQSQVLAPMNYIMPAGVDPIFLDFTFDGQQYTVSGLDLLPSTFTGGGDGRSFRVPHANVSGIQFYKFRITTTYEGGFTIASQKSPSFPQSPWTVTPDPLGGLDVVASPGSALVGEPTGPDRYFATFISSLDSFNGVNAFAASTFVITGYAVPEPGSAAAVACIVSVAGSVLLRGRKRRS